jgi:hypothetical protein
MNKDQEHLRLLSIFHYVLGGMTALFTCIPCFNFPAAIVSVKGPFPVLPGEEGPATLLRWVFIFMAIALILVGWTLAVALLVAGRFLARRTRYMYCLVVAAIECLFLMPVGTVLGVFTIIVLSRPSVKALFQPNDVSHG